MCLPVGLLSFLAKTCTTYVLGFSLYCLYSYAEKGMLSMIGQTIPIFLTILIFLLTACCSCLGLNKQYTCASICAMLLAGMTFAIVALLTNLALEFFDFKKGCQELAKINPMLDLFIDKNMDKYFEQTSSAICSPQCPCLWNENTEVLQKNPKKFVVDNVSGVRSAIECQSYLTDIQFEVEKQQYLQLMIQLELYGCSGYCEKKDYFSVTNINHGLPKHSCFDVNRLIQKKSLDTIFLGMHLLMWVIVILVPSTCCLLFQRSRKDAERREMMEKVESLKSEFMGGTDKGTKQKKSSSSKKAKEGDEDADDDGKGEQEEEEEKEINPTQDIKDTKKPKEKTKSKTPLEKKTD